MGLTLWGNPGSLTEHAAASSQLESEGTGVFIHQLPSVIIGGLILEERGPGGSLQTVEGNGKWKPNQHTVTWIKLRGYMQRGHGVPWLGAQ